MENRNSAIAGEDYIINRNYKDDVAVLSDEIKKKLTKARIITTIKNGDGSIGFSDILNGEVKELKTNQYPLYDALTYLQREGARLIASRTFKRMNDSVLYIQKQIDIVLKNADRNGFFNSEIEEDNRFSATVRPVANTNDMIEIVFEVYGNTHIRRGKISLTNK